MFKIANHYVPKIVFILLVVELFILLSAAYFGMNIRLIGAPHWTMTFKEFFPSACTFAIAIIVGMSALGMYQRDFRDGLQTTFLLLMPSFAMGLGILIIIFYLAPDLYFGRGILLLAFLMAGAGIFTARAIVFKLSKLRFQMSRVIFLGASELARECTTVAKNNISHHQYDIVGFVPVPDEADCVSAEFILRTNESLLSIAKKCNITEIVVAVSNRRGGNLRIHELLECKLNGIQVIDAATFFERQACQIRVESLQPSWLVFGTGFDQSAVRTFIKRGFDLTVSTVILTASIPVLLITALCIYIEDGSPIFYQQERVGKNGQPFMVLKFRSMRNDAEKAGKPQWAAYNDPRTTRIGAIIRKLRIDELPQILNVFKGEMSFVGPRPERPFFVKQLSDEILFYNVRHSIKPGITGWAQVRYQYGASVEDAIQKLQYDLYYVKNNSLFLDILILIDTLRVVMFGTGR